MFGTPLVTISLPAIPNTSQPNLFIAPWVEDLDPGAGGTIPLPAFWHRADRYWVAQMG